MKWLPEEKERDCVAAKTNEFVSAMVDWFPSSREAIGISKSIYSTEWCPKA